MAMVNLILSTQRIPEAVSLPPKCHHMYGDFITKNASPVSQIESALRPLTSVIPGVNCAGGATQKVKLRNLPKNSPRTTDNQAHGASVGNGGETTRREGPVEGCRHPRGCEGVMPAVTLTTNELAATVFAAAT